ncbi:hypothetical protein IJI55_02010 [Candidatus Saccharibacteria bacterium]|nr:hypothetical protein [Candidatus Saccharibacteria bacterium]MBR3323288.1 hypothetical protein [Candidatus Saccharibacteria bacterium]
MKVVVVWRDNTDYAREVEMWMNDFQHDTGKEVESLDPDSVEGEIFAKARDIVEYPSVVAVSDDGAVLKIWRGTPMPQIDEVSYYVREQ